MFTNTVFISTFVLGALHALEPGHGKAFIASYMVGQKLRIKHLFSMLGSLLVSHFLLLTVLALVLKFLLSGVDPHMLEEISSWVAPVLILGFGVYLFFRYRNHSHAEDDCNCALHEHSHDHDHAHDHSHSHDHSHDHAHTHDHEHDHEHSHSHNTDKARNPALVGLITGLVPCPSVFAPVILASTAGFSNILVTIGIYVIGMIITLSAIVGVFFVARNKMEDQLVRISQRINLHTLSAILIMVVGLVYFGMNFIGEPGHHHHH